MDKKEYMKKWRENNKEKIKEYNKIYSKKIAKNKSVYKKDWANANKETIKEKQRIWYENNKEKILENKKNTYANNKEKLLDYALKNKVKIAERVKIHREKNKEKILERENIYREKNKEKIKLKRKENNSKPINLLKTSIRKSITQAFKRNGYVKNSKTHILLGCTFDELKIHLEVKFEPWMNWVNKGLYNGTPNYGWDIDHIVPLSSAKTEDEVVKLLHYTNLQPLCSKINRDVKKDKMVNFDAYF
jgi:hypothetical protein